MSTFNLIRNSRVWFTSNVVATGSTKGAVNDVSVNSSAFTSVNTQELQVLDGFSFNQASNADTITLNESGSNPVRGQRSFNTSLSNVEFSFSTYLRPKLVSSNVNADEACLWNALLAVEPISASATITGGITTVGMTVSNTTITFTGSTEISGYAGIAVGDIAVVKGVTGSAAAQYNTAIRITAASSTSIVGVYLIAPSVPPSALVAVLTPAFLTLTKSAWNTHAAQATLAIPLKAYAEITTAFSDKNQLQAFGLIMAIDGITYFVDNCVLDQAVIDFGLDGIGMVAWTGKGQTLRQASTAVTSTTDGTFATGIAGSYGTRTLDASFITNKLSTLYLKSGVGGDATSGTQYALALTGGSITIANNTTYLTPANLGVLNKPIGYYTGTRAISGTLTAYLRTGSTNTGGLFSTILGYSGTNAIEPKFKLQVNLGGVGDTRVEFEINSAFLQTPTIDAAAVMSTTINFTAEGVDPASAATTFDIENPTELEVRYFAS